MGLDVVGSGLRNLFKPISSIHTYLTTVVSGGGSHGLSTYTGKYKRGIEGCVRVFMILL